MNLWLRRRSADRVSLRVNQDSTAPLHRQFVLPCVWLSLQQKSVIETGAAALTSVLGIRVSRARDCRRFAARVIVFLRLNEMLHKAGA